MCTSLVDLCLLEQTDLAMSVLMMMMMMKEANEQEPMNRD
jgi:hypothetical protein